MGLREKLNNKPALAVSVFIALLAGTITVIAWQWRGGEAGSITQAFYSTDDGASWFKDDVAKVPPFDHGGVTAVRAYVMDSDGRKAVYYLERFTPEKCRFVEAAKQAALDKKMPPKPPMGAGVINWGNEVKKPGEKQWTSATNLQAASKIQMCETNDGKPGVPVMP